MVQKLNSYRDKLTGLSFVTVNSNDTNHFTTPKKTDNRMIRYKKCLQKQKKKILDTISSQFSEIRIQMTNNTQKIEQISLIVFDHDNTKNTDQN